MDRTESPSLREDIIVSRARSEDLTTHERCREKVERGHRRSFFTLQDGCYMTSRYMCRAYHVSDASTPPWIVQRVHYHAMMSSGARDMLCYLYSTSRAMHSAMMPRWQQRRPRPSHGYSGHRRADSAARTSSSATHPPSPPQPAREITAAPHRRGLAR